MSEAWDSDTNLQSLIDRLESATAQVAEAALTLQQAHLELAKVTRDRLMRALAEQYPTYFFQDNKGYPCPRHRAALAQIGASVVHRHSWSFMDALPDSGIELRRNQQHLFNERAPV